MSPPQSSSNGFESLDPRLTLKEIVQSLNWLRHYQRQYLAGDFIAGLTIAVMLIPQSMAYGLLAGLDPIVGLYASIVPVLIYGLLGSTGVMTLGPTAITSVMTLSTVGVLAGGDPARMMVLAATLALILGVVYVLMGLMRLGFIVNLLSQPVLIGYVNAAAIIIAVSQLQHLLGVSVERASNPFIILLATLHALPATNPVTLLIGVSGIAILLFFRYPLDGILRRFGLGETARFIITRSGSLLLTLGGTLIVYLLRLDQTMNVAVVGDIPRGFPTLNIAFHAGDLQVLVLGAVAIAFVGLMEDISTAKTLVSQRQQRINANQEMLAMGAANIASAFTGGLPVTTSISRSAVNHSAGGRTGLSSIIAAVMLALTVMFFTPLFYYLPRAILGAIIMTSVISLIKPAEFRQLWHYSQIEMAIALITVAATFLVRIELGILFGVVLMILLYIYRTARPEIIELGRSGYTKNYEAIDHEDTMPIPHTMIIQIHESLYFANAQYLDQYLRNLIADREDLIYLVLDCSAVNTIDASAVQILEGLIHEFAAMDIIVYIVGLKSRVFVKLRAGQLKDILGAEHMFSTVHEAVEATGQLLDDQLPI